MARAPGEAPRAYGALLRLLRTLVSVFFREVEVTGLEHVPLDRGGVIVSWHPNGLVDPGLILTQFPRPVTFGARHGLFKVPVLGALLRSIGTVPIYRQIDAKPGATVSDADRRRQNQRTLDALAEAVAAGSFAALFPEGVSHDEPHPVELKTGAARLYYRARELRAARDPKAEPPVIILVGLHYDKKKLFRSRALVWFHRPLELLDLDVTPDPDDDEATTKARAKKLTDGMERVLHDIVLATEDWEIHALLHRARKLIRAERARRAGADPGKPGIEEKALGFARIRAAYYARRTSDPERVAVLRARVERYDADLRALRLDDHELDRAPDLASFRLAAVLVAQVVLVFLVVPPILVFGYLVNGPTALALVGLSRVAARLEKDVATIKLLGGAVAFPLTWVAAAVLAALGRAELQARLPGIPEGALAVGLFAGVVAALGGAAALRYLEIAGETLRAVRVRLTRARHRRTVEHLLAERRALADALLGMAEGLELPGAVAPDGTISRAS